MLAIFVWQRGNIVRRELEGEESSELGSLERESELQRGEDVDVEN